MGGLRDTRERHVQTEDRMLAPDHDDVARRIAAGVLALRRKHGWSRFRLAVHSDVTEQTIYRIEKCKGGLPEWGTLEKLAAAGDMTLWALLNGEEEDSTKRALFNASPLAM